MALAAGTRLGRYEIVGLLGAGGMGEVYRARDERLHREVALKVLHPGPAADAARLLREARVVSTLSDPHIVTVHDADECDGIAFVAMELVDGAPLTRRVRPGGLPVDELLRIGIDVAAGLARAHAAGVVHRDLKPANVMVTTSGTAKILDFGLATQPEGRSGDTSTFAAMSGPGVVAGTVGYMSPEQAEGRAVDARSDIFAFGVLLYELATGHRPFDRDSAVATLAAILRDPAPPVSDLRPDLPRALARLVERCLRKEPERRFHAVADVQIALEDLRDDVSRGMAGAAVGAAATPEPRSRRWPGVAAAVLLAGAAAAAATVAWWRPSVPPPLTGLDLAQLTYDGGYSGTPALSPDGTLLAFASDRSGDGNLDIWVQPVAGGQAVQVTKEAADERMPAFTPDGGRIVFRSEREGGGIYSIATLGGEPRLLAAGGLSPKVAPDGRLVAYWTGTFIGFDRTPGGYRTFVVDAAGGTPREITGFTNSFFPAWSPDGGRLIVSATQAEKPDAATYDWWIAPLDGGPPVATGARNLLGRAASEVSAQGSPSAWTGDRVLTSWRGDLWAVVLTGPNGTAAGIERLTFGPGSETEPTATPDGRVAFADEASRLNVWSLPIDTEQARLLGDFRKVTGGTGPFSRATISADERLATFFGPGRPSIHVQDLATGRVRDLGGTPGAVFGPVISPDGQRVAYPTNRNEVRVVAVAGGAPTALCRDCQQAGDWTADSQRLTVVTAGNRTALALADTRTGAVTALVDAPDDRSLNRPTLSPDDRWIAFRAMGPGAQTVYVAPFQRSLPIPADAWIAVGAPERDLRPIGWSPSGRMLYLFSARDGFRCLYVQRIDPAAGRPLGPATIVKHLHNLRGPGGGGGSVVGSGAGHAVGRRQILFDFPELEVNVWQMRLGVLMPPGATPSTTPP